MLAMPRQQGRVHVVRVRKTHVDKQGRRREYTSAYLRRTYRDGDHGAQRDRGEPVDAAARTGVNAIEAGLKGKQLVPAGSAVTHHPVAAARARGRGGGDGAPSWACPRCWARRAGHGTWPWR